MTLASMLFRPQQRSRRHIAYLDMLAGWLAAHGIAPDAADRSVANTFAGLNLPVVGGETLGEHARHYATP